MRIHKLGYILLEFPMKVYNLYNMKEEDYSLLKDSFCTTQSNYLYNFIEVVEKLRPEIEKVGKEKTYLRLSVGYKYLNSHRKHTSPRKLLDAIDMINIFDKTILTDSSYRKVNICSDKELVKLIEEDKEFFNNLIHDELFVRCGTKPGYFLYATLIMMHGNPYK